MSLSNTPEELEKLMWSVAESGDPNAVDEFGQRYPHLRGELGKRISMVRNLKGAVKANQAPQRIPKFENRPIRTSPIRPSVWVGGGLVLAAVAAAAFVVTKTLTRSAPAPEPIPVVETGPAKLPESPVHYKNPTAQPNSSPSGQSQPNLNQDLVQSEKDPSQSPQDVKFESVRLETAVKAIAANGGLELEMAPNMPNPLVRIDYHGYSALEILQDMGTRFGFTAFDNGPHKVLIIPARDSHDTTPRSGDASRVTPAPTVTPGTPKESDPIIIVTSPKQGNASSGAESGDSGSVPKKNPLTKPGSKPSQGKPSQGKPAKPNGTGSTPGTKKPIPLPTSPGLSPNTGGTGTKPFNA